MLRVFCARGRNIFIMKLITNVEYFTRWGEELFLRAFGRLYGMEYAGDGKWRAVIGKLEPGRTFEYRYELHSGGLCRRTEWEPHVVTMPEKNSRKPLEIRDSWNDVPDGLPFRSAPFAEGVFDRCGDGPWKAAGTAVPVFSLRSRNSFGIGEFHDLKLLVDWAARTGQKVLQLLPVNDTTMTGTWEDSYPYNANSSFALHPQFIHLPDTGVPEDEAYMRLKDELDSLPEVDYERVNREKERLLREAFRTGGAKLARTGAYKTFMEENAHWLLPYAAYSVLRDEFGTADCSLWKRGSGKGNAGEDYSVYDREKVSAYIASHRKETGYYCFVQYHLHVQLSEARDYAHSRGIVFKGDLPIGVSRTSADAWVNRKLFNMDSQAGAPPDAFSADGQNWGFPTYNWDEMAKDGYAWWKARMKSMSQYFDVFRIDHILGFFRIWEIPVSGKSGLMGHFNPALPYQTGELERMGFHVSGIPGRKVRDDGKDVLFVEDPHRKGWWHPRIAAQFTEAYSRLDDWHKQAFDRLYDDFFYHRHNAFWKESAMRKLPSLLSATGMLACGEDLGMVPDCVQEVMNEYSILSLEIQRMPKSPRDMFGDPAHYPYYSVCTTSTHDMNPIRAWWEEDRKVTCDFWHAVMHRSGDAPVVCEPWICGEIVRKHLESSSMLTILPLQDWLSVDGDLRLADPAKERINVPSIPRYYWRYRMHLTLEDLLSQDRFNDMVREMICSAGRKG